MALAEWRDGQLILHDSTQGASATRDIIAGVLGLPAERVRVISPHVGGGFGSKGITQTQSMLAALAAQVAGRPVKVAYTRQQMWSRIGYRAPYPARSSPPVMNSGCAPPPRQPA